MPHDNLEARRARTGWPLALVLVAFAAACSPYEPGPPPPPELKSTRWDWEHPRPQGQGLVALGQRVPGESWVVGVGGAMLARRDGGWQLHDNPSPHTLLALCPPIDGTLWAVGGEGTVLRNDGRGWSPVLGVPRVQLHDVTGYLGQPWLCGDRGLLLYYNGTNFVSRPTGTTRLLTALASVDSTLFVGDLLGEVRAFRAQRFERLERPSANFLLRDLHAAGRDSLFACGQSPGLAHWDGTRWQELPLPGPYEDGILLHDLFVGADGALRVAGEHGQLFVQRPGGWEDDRDAGLLEAGALYAGGHDGNTDLLAGTGGSLWRREAGGSWQPEHESVVPRRCVRSGSSGAVGTLCTVPPLLDLAVAGGEAWAIHDEGLLRRDAEGHWRPAELPPSPTTSLRGVDARPGGDLLVASEGAALVREGGSWRRVPLQVSPPTGGAVSFAPDDQWILDQGSGAWRYDGDRWARVNPPGNQRIFDVEATGPTERWLLTGGRTLHRGSGGDFPVQLQLPPAHPILLGLEFDPADSTLHAFGDDGLVAKVTPAGLEDRMALGDFRVGELWAGGDGTLFALGDRNRIFRRAGGFWEELPDRMPSLQLQALDGEAGLGLFVAGENSSLLHLPASALR